MPRMTIHMLGIMYFNVCEEDARTVLLPDGTKGHDDTPPHFASFFVERSRCDGHETWPGKIVSREVPILTARHETVMIPILEFQLASFADIEFPPDQSGKVDVGDLPEGLPSIRDADPRFDPDLTGKTGAIARIEIGSGQLRAFKFNGGASAVQWTIRSGAAPLRITATAKDAHGKPQSGHLFLKPNPDNPFGAEVVFANMPDFLSTVMPDAKSHSHGGRDPHAVHHYGLYGRIDKNHGNPRFPPYYTDIEHRTPVIASLRYANVDSSCGPGCC